MKELKTVKPNSGKEYEIAQSYLDEISLMCEMFFEVTNKDDFNPNNFDGTILNAISALAKISTLSDTLKHRKLFLELRAKIYQWYSFILDDSDEFTNNFIEGIYITLDAISQKHFLSLKPDINHSLISEKKYQDDIINRFNEIDRFKGYKLVKPEHHVNGGIIDILAYENETKRDVLMELKLSGKSGHKQLHQYGFHFKNPILINISEKIPVNLFEGIEYLTFSELS